MCSRVLERDSGDGLTVMTTAARSPRNLADEVLAGGGEMGAMMRAFDWSKTPVGPVDHWPQSLRTAVSIALASGYPMLVVWGPNYVQFYNDAYRPVLGASKHPAALGQSTYDCFPEVWDDIIRPMFERVRNLGQATSYHDYLFPLHRYGYTEECYFDFSYSAVRDETGGVGGVFVTCSETTGRVLGERRLATLREIGSTAGDAHNAVEACANAAAALARNTHDVPFALIYLKDADRAQARLVGVTGLERNHPALVTNADLTAAEARWPIWQVIRGGEAQLLADLSGHFGNLTAGPWPEAVTNALVLPITQAGSLGQIEVTGALVAGISPRRALDDEYRGFLELVAGQVGSAVANARAYQVAVERAEALAELDRAKTAFFSNISHEFRTPLTLSLGPLEELLQARDGAQRLSVENREQLEMVHRNTLRLLRLVNTLLEFSRLEAGRAQASFRPTDLSTLTADLASIFRAAVERARLDLIIDAEPLPEPIYLDADMWEKIVLNLLSNALKFTFEGNIKVSVRPAGSAAVVTVADTGVGIPAAEIARIFERFHRVQNTRSRTYEGSGIGLALVKELVEIHGGKVEVESQIGKGSSFTIRIPFGTAHLPQERVVPGEAGAGSPSRDALSMVEEAYRWLPPVDDVSGEATLPEAISWEAEQSVKGARVLVADDNQDMRQYLVRLLSAHFRVDAVADGASALATAKDALPDLVVTDVMMPGMDGFQLLRALRSDEATANIPVLMLSARAGEEATVEGLEAGADDYLTKPFTARELLARIRANLLMAKARSETALTRARYESAISAQQRALEVLLAVSRHLESTSELDRFFGELTATIRDLVNARFAVFFRLDEAAGTLSAQRKVSGVSDEVLKAMRDVPCRPDGTEVADQIVYHGLDLGPADLKEARFDVYRARLEQMGVHDAIATAWRAGDKPLGTLTAYDSRRPSGFTEEDLWVLKIGALAAGLVWQHKMAERKLDEARQHEAQFLRAQVERMTELERLKSQFLRLASHELRGPLTILRGYLEMIMTGTLGPTAPGITPIYPILAAKVQEMGQLVNRMLETARLEDNQFSLALDDIDVGVLVSESVAAIAPLRLTSHRFELDLPDEPVMVKGDQQRIGSVITNLLDNAVKYSPDGGAIAVRCAADEDSGTVTVWISDQGIGIDSDDLPRLFSRFGRVVNGDNSHIPGAGLGLYLSREIARMHGGDITIASERGRGTTVTFSLPLAEVTSRAVAR